MPTGQFPKQRPNPGQVVQMQPAQQPETIHMSFSAPILPQTTEVLIRAMAEWANRGVKRVHLQLSTPGGSVMSGITLYNTLKAFPFTLVTHNAGSVNSIGNAVFLAGAERYATAYSTFMFHGVGFDITEPTRLEEKMLRERLDSLRADQRRIAAIIGERSNLDPDKIEQFFLEATTKDAPWALEHGIIDGIRDIEVPAGQPVQAFTFQGPGVVGG